MGNIQTMNGAIGGIGQDPSGAYTVDFGMDKWTVAVSDGIVKYTLGAGVLLPASGVVADVADTATETYYGPEIVVDLGQWCSFNSPLIDTGNSVADAEATRTWQYWDSTGATFDSNGDWTGASGAGWKTLKHSAHATEGDALEYTIDGSTNANWEHGKFGVTKVRLIVGLTVNDGDGSDALAAATIQGLLDTQNANAWIKVKNVYTAENNDSDTNPVIVAGHGIGADPS